ncbi:unnamed protein product [Ceutorhynchus assimilis]|uniref:Uncharacterized protein n=1 Tax=Ceutorhynchus assimilis TaxID=467358 RepID=A0A9P0GQP5_9CUCU|nr:unnamed protein product [Ceutorhynchus assimilis]
MCEALAERLLDLHCRLLSLYILQDADCLDWENEKPFFESERGSYIIQMWWLYMQGIKEDLWNTVPPKMAQRVFSGMLNESLTILTVRYTQSLPSEARSNLLLVDISNLLLCVAQLLPATCDSADEYVNVRSTGKNKILRDIHVKCQELYLCFLFRGATLDSLNKVFKKGLENNELFKPKSSGPAAWITFSLPNIFKNSVTRITQLDQQKSLAIELMVLLAQPQPNWALLLKVLCGKKFKILQLLLQEFMEKSNVELKRPNPKSVDCGNLLCAGDGSCKDVDTSLQTFSPAHYHDLIMAATEVILYIGNDEEIKEFLVEVVMKYPGWSKSFERTNLWNQIRFPWYEAIVNVASPILPLIGETVINALQTGATMYQTMSLIIACLSQFWDMLDSALLRIATLFQDGIPSDVRPVSDSVLMHILVSALYSHLISMSENVSTKKEVTFSTKKIEESPASDSAHTIGWAALAAAESLCSIDEDHKHTDQITEFLNEVQESKNDFSFYTDSGSNRLENNQQMIEILVSDLLASTQGKKGLKTLFHFIKNNSEWLYLKLGVSEKQESFVPNKVQCPPEPLLHKMFHIGYRPFDQLLSEQLKPNWLNLLQTSMGVTSEKVWMQLRCRWEFRTPECSTLTSHEVDIVNQLCLMLK